MKCTLPDCIKAGFGYYTATLSFSQHRIIYRLFTKGQAWVDRGAAQFEQMRQTRDLARLQAQASSRGFHLVPDSDPVITTETLSRAPE